MVVNCLVCGVEFKTVLSRIRDGKGKYCSRTCLTKKRNENRPKICVIDICRKETYALSWCKTHYDNRLRYGDPEATLSTSTGQYELIHLLYCAECGTKEGLTKNGRGKPRKDRTIDQLYLCSACSRLRLARQLRCAPSTVVKACEACGTAIYLKPNQVKRGFGKFCSHSCATATIKPGTINPLSGDEHPLWKGEKVGYSGLHKWVVRQLGKPTTCEECGNEVDGISIHWANKSGNYLRDVTDWIRLCASCHTKFDRAFPKNARSLFPDFKWRA